MSPTLANVIVSGVSLGGIWWLLVWGYRDYRIDLFRQRLFKLRDQLFDDAASGQLSFDDDAYGMLRVMMNGSIRFAHRWSALHFLGIAVFVAPVAESRELREHWAAALERVGPERAARYARLREQFHGLVLEHAVVGSPFFLGFIIAVMLSLIPAMVVRRTTKRILGMFETKASEFDAVAYACGQSA